MARKKRHTEHADERWLLTYADMITLLMALFMVLFSMSVVNKGKFEELSRSLKESFAGPLADGGRSVLKVGGNNPTLREPRSEATGHSPKLQPIRRSSAVGAPATVAAERDARAQEDQLRAAQRRIDATIRALGLERVVTTTIDERGLVIRLTTDDVLFAVGRADVRPAAVPLLAVVARAVNGVGANPVEVEGHTDTRPFPGDRWGNYTLSHDRALNVWKIMVAHGFSPDRHGNAVPVGWADRRLLVPADGHDARNRRVEVIVRRIDVAARARAAERAAHGPVGARLPEPPAVVPAPRSIVPATPAGHGDEAGHEAPADEASGH